MSRYAAFCLAMAAGAHAIVGPNLPWGGITDVAGQDCKIGWTVDTTGQWTNMSIELMTGDNQDFVHLSWVTRGLDGTKVDSYTWTCPTVDPPAPIYFYQFVNPGQSATYTTRFTLAAADGTVVAAPEATQPDGQAIPWGTGSILSGGDGTADNGGGSGSNNNSTSRPSSGTAIDTSSGDSSLGSSPETSISSDSTASSLSGTGSSSSSTSSSTSSSSLSTTSSSSTDDQVSDTTVITVQPSTTARTTGSTTSSRMSGTAINAGNAATTSNSTTPTGAASKKANTQGNMAAGGALVLALVAGWIMA